MDIVNCLCEDLLLVCRLNCRLSSGVIWFCSRSFYVYFLGSIHQFRFVSSRNKEVFWSLPPCIYVFFHNRAGSLVLLLAILISLYLPSASSCICLYSAILAEVMSLYHESLSLAMCPVVLPFTSRILEFWNLFLKVFQSTFLQWNLGWNGIRIGFILMIAMTGRWLLDIRPGFE